MSLTMPILRERSLLHSLLRMSDAVCVLIGFMASLTHPRVAPEREFFLAIAVAVIVMYCVGELTGLYHSWRGVSLYREIAAAEITWAHSLVVLLVLGFLTRYLDSLPRFGLILAAVSVAALLAASRVMVRFVQRSARAHGYNLCHYAFVGVNDLAIRLARNLEHSPELGLQLVGFFDDRAAERTAELPAQVGRQVGRFDELIELARQGAVQRIYITLPMRAEKRIRNLLKELADTTAAVYIVPDFFVFELLHARWTDVNGLPVVSVFESPFYGVDGVLKRACDFTLAVCFLTIASLPMALIAALVKCTSSGPVFFRQKRYGLDGREIHVWKFRSMRVCENGATISQATRRDPRVTPVGAFLRRTSLDELPQLFNVLDGSMSLVGPRPHATAHNEHYRRLIPGYMLRHKVKPGITGLAQVRGFRGETDSLDKMANRIQCDLQYIREWSIWLDMQILFQTVRVVLSRQNAY
ncbi:MAG: undecaprenyl-phosphate glucose phosphotransferase [Pirellulaceae bacterium]